MIGWSIRLRVVPVGHLYIQGAPFLGRGAWHFPVGPAARQTL